MFLKQIILILTVFLFSGCGVSETPLSELNSNNIVSESLNESLELTVSLRNSDYHYMLTSTNQEELDTWEEIHAEIEGGYTFVRYENLSYMSRTIITLENIQHNDVIENGYIIISTYSDNRIDIEKEISYRSVYDNSYFLLEEFFELLPNNTISFSGSVRDFMGALLRLNDPWGGIGYIHGPKNYSPYISSMDAGIDRTFIIGNFGPVAATHLTSLVGFFKSNDGANWTKINVTMDTINNKFIMNDEARFLKIVIQNTSDGYTRLDTAPVNNLWDLKIVKYNN